MGSEMCIRDSRYTGCGGTRYNIGKGICRKRPDQSDDVVPDDFAPGADDAGSLCGSGVYRSGCCTSLLQ